MTSKHHQQSWDQEKFQAEASDKVRELWGGTGPVPCFCCSHGFERSSQIPQGSSEVALVTEVAVAPL